MHSRATTLSKLAKDDGTIRLFEFHAAMEGQRQFPARRGAEKRNGALSLALGAFYFRSVDERKRFLFFRWGAQKVHFWTAAQRMTLNTEFYARRRDDVAGKLEADASKFIGDLKLGTR